MTLPLAGRVREGVSQVQLGVCLARLQSVFWATVKTD
jgi:hypothetical protein